MTEATVAMIPIKTMPHEASLRVCESPPDPHALARRPQRTASSPWQHHELPRLMGAVAGPSRGGGAPGPERGDLHGHLIEQRAPPRAFRAQRKDHQSFP